MERVTRNEAFVTELDEPFRNVCGIKPEVFGTEFLATAPVTDGGCDEHAPAAHGVEEWCGCVVRIHNDDWLLVCCWLG